MLDRLRNPWSDNRAERTLGAVSLLVCACVIGMIVFVFIRAWPIFEHNGLSWLGPGGSLKTQLENMQATSVNPPASAYHLRAWPIIYGTILTTGIAVVLGVVIAVLSSIFIVELAPARLRRVAIPVIRLLASVPSVIYGLIGDPRARAVRRQPPDHRRAEDLGAELGRAHRRRSAGRGGDP